jgi:hypothetical protein
MVQRKMLRLIKAIHLASIQINKCIYLLTIYKIIEIYHTNFF